MAPPRRRTHLYNASYNIGENYYKSALDSIDRKYSGRRDPIESPAALGIPAPSPRPKVNFDDSVYDGELANARRRAERAITEDTFFDSKGARVVKNNAAKAFDDIDEEIQASLNRIRASKKAIASSDDLEDTISSVKRRARIDLGEKLDAAAASSSGDSGAFRATLKVVTRRRQEVEPSSTLKWTKVTQEDNSHSSAASLRAQASKTRLQELDADIYERGEKQLAREKRSAQLKQFLVDSDIETVRADRR